VGLHSDERLKVCLGYPAVQGTERSARVRAIDPRIDVLELPVDPDADWLSIPPVEPHEEPPAWAKSVAAERRAALREAQVLIALQTPRNLMELAPKLRWIQSVGAGVDQFVAAGVDGERVLVTNASGLSAPSMAEFVLGRLLEIWKRFREMEALQREHRYVQAYGRTFRGSVVGIVGMGSIGGAVAERARALGAHVLGMRRSARPGDAPDPADELFAPGQLHAMLARCDAVVVVAPATPETRHLIDARALAAMRSGAVLVNVARGSLVDESALVEALRDGHVSAAALDVFETEPLPAESPLWELPNVYVSAHSSVSVDRYLDDIFELFVENLERFVAGRELRNRVDTRALGFR